MMDALKLNLAIYIMKGDPFPNAKIIKLLSKLLPLVIHI
jgi:hypothetical protein